MWSSPAEGRLAYDVGGGSEGKCVVVWFPEMGAVDFGWVDVGVSAIWGRGRGGGGGIGEVGVVLGHGGGAGFPAMTRSCCGSSDGLVGRACWLVFGPGG